MKIEIPKEAVDQLLENDEGELHMAIGISDGVVIMHFGKPVVWIGMGADDARALANQLLEKAADLKAQQS